MTETNETRFKMFLMPFYRCDCELPDYKLSCVITFVLLLISVSLCFVRDRTALYSQGSNRLFACMGAHVHSVQANGLITLWLHVT